MHFVAKMLYITPWPGFNLGGLWFINCSQSSWSLFLGSENIEHVYDKLECPLSTALYLAVENLRGISVTPETSQAFITNLGFSTEEFRAIPTDLLSICNIWMDKRSTCYMEELVEALVHTQGLGRYTTQLCSHRKCSDWLNGCVGVIFPEDAVFKTKVIVTLYKQSVPYW